MSNLPYSRRAGVDFPQVISEAEVRNNTSLNADGSVYAYIKAIDESVSVIYTSPYGARGQGGFIAIPEVGTKILVVRPEGSGEWFYLSTVWVPEPKPEYTKGTNVIDSNVPPVLRCEPDLYKAVAQPKRYVFKSPEGRGLTISDEASTNAMSKFVELRTPKNKRIKLDDTPHQDAVIIESGNNSYIKLAASPDNILGGASQSVEVFSTGPQTYRNQGDETTISVGGTPLSCARELNLLNQADGILNGVPPWFKPPLGIPPPLSPCGNINIQSSWRDVNIFSKSPTGRIFIECLNPIGIGQSIVIETNSVSPDSLVRIKTNGRVQIDAATELEVYSPIINMNCATFNVNAAAAVNIDSPLIKIGNSTSVVNLAPPTPPLVPIITVPGPAGTLNPAAILDSDYGNIGVPTFDGV